MIGLGLPDLNELGWRWKDSLIYLTHGVPNEPTFSTAAHRRARRRRRRSPRSIRRATSSCRCREVQRVLDAAREPKRLWIVEASDHRFSDNLPEFDRRLLEAIAWVAQQRARAEAADAATGCGRPLPASSGWCCSSRRSRCCASSCARSSWHELTGDVPRTPAAQLALALVLTALNYAALTGYDLLAFAYIGKPLPRAPHRVRRRSSPTPIANNVGFAMLSGASVRYRFYTRWGVTAEELSRIVFSYSVTFWLGLLGARRAEPRVSPLPPQRELPGARAADRRRLAADARAAGVPRRRRSCGEAAPPPRLRAAAAVAGIAVAQLLLSAIDWALAGAVLYVLLPPSALSFLAVPRRLPGRDPARHGQPRARRRRRVRGADGAAAQAVPHVRRQLLPALVVYRVVYYLLPLAVALIVLVADEVRQRRAHVARVGARLGRLTERLTPRVLAVFTFLAGVVLLFSGATPAAAGTARAARSRSAARRHRDVALPRQRRRRRAADPVAGPGATARRRVLPDGDRDRRRHGRVAAEGLRLRGGRAPAAGAPGAVAGAAGVRSPRGVLRHAILRRAGSRPLAGALGASIWLGLFAFKHVDYSRELWWQFELQGEASRFLRASVGAASWPAAVRRSPG